MIFFVVKGRMVTKMRRRLEKHTHGTVGLYISKLSLLLKPGRRPRLLRIRNT